MKSGPGHLMHNYGVDVLAPGADLSIPIYESRDTAPAPRDLFRQTCETVAARFKTDGYQYLRSKHALVRAEKDLRFGIGFITSRWNMRGSYVRVSPIVEIISKTLNEWRKRHAKLTNEFPLRSAGKWIIYAGLHNTFNETFYRKFPTSFEWNVANPETRDEVINDIISFLRMHTLPYFQNFYSPEGIIERLITADKDCRTQTSVPGLELGDAVEYTLCFGTLDQASAVLFRYNKLLLDRHGSEIERRFQMFRQSGLSRAHLSGFGFKREIEQIQRIWKL